jgi:DNA invertase Pin-like site-specific DNA recombinase
VKAGDVLLVESVDRISRQGIDEGYDLLKRILKAGVHIITLEPERDFGPDAVKGLCKGALELQIILERAHEESLMKSARRKYSWKKLREKARTGSKALWKTCPAWLEVTPGGFPREAGGGRGSPPHLYPLPRRDGRSPDRNHLGAR